MINQLFPLIKTRYVEASEIEKFDPRHLSFFNVNTKADLKKARELAGGRER
jgi:molybdopterin-guanine dinucleotide biosynthesis protein A